MFKCKFLNKLAGLRISGDKVEVLKMVDEWLEANEDRLFQEMADTQMMKAVDIKISKSGRIEAQNYRKK